MKTAFRANATVIVITDEELQELQASESAYVEKLMPHLVTLTADQRLRLPKIGTANIDFTSVAMGYGRAHPELVPPYVDIEVSASNLELFNALRTLQQQRAVTDRLIEDTMMQCGSAAYGGGLGFYDSTKASAKKGLVGAIPIAEDLGARLPTRATRSRVPPKPVDGGA